MSTAEAAKMTADYLREHGWRIGGAGLAENAPACLLVASRRCGIPVDVRRRLARSVARRAGLPRDFGFRRVAAWNDEQPSVEPVLAVLDAIAGGQQ